jgi:hypothetical protein
MKQPFARSTNSTVLPAASTAFDDGCRSENAGGHSVWHRSEMDGLPGLVRPAAAPTGQDREPAKNRRARTRS